MRHASVEPAARHAREAPGLSAEGMTEHSGMHVLVVFFSVL